MPIPDFQTIMLPLLQFMKDDKEHSIQEIVDNLSRYFKLSNNELSEVIPSGKQTLFYNRVGWARTYLSKASILQMTKRPYYKITDRGHQVLNENPDKIGISYLMKYPEFIEFRERKSKTDQNGSGSVQTEAKTPEEILEDAYDDIRVNLEQE